MKKYLIFIVFPLMLLFNGCNNDETVSERDKRLTNENQTEQENNVINDDINSYWFVVVVSKNNGMLMNGCYKQDHRHFSMSEHKNTFSVDVFVVSFTRISEETYNSN